MGILDNAKELAELIKKYNNQDLYQKVIDLRDEIFNLREEKQQLKERVNELERAENIGSKLERQGNVYFRTDREEDQAGPFCMTCWDADRKLVNVITITEDGSARFKCSICIKR